MDALGNGFVCSCSEQSLVAFVGPGGRWCVFLPSSFGSTTDPAKLKAKDLATQKSYYGFNAHPNHDLEKLEPVLLRTERDGG